MTAREKRAVGALVGVSAVTVGWWALALWPTSPGAAPEWFALTREVCFRIAENGLPDPAGWLTLTGQPIAMFGILLFGWGRDLRSALGSVAEGRFGRPLVAVTGLTVALAMTAVGARVYGAISTPPDPSAAGPATAPGVAPADVPRLDRAAPALRLIDQHGETATLARFRGRPVLVTFAFGHCEAVCPTLVQEVLAARRRLSTEGTDVAVLVLTLDPWRDTPARLEALAERWGLPAHAFLLSGGVEAVERTLDAWNVARARDTRTGDVAHPRLVYVLDGTGRIAFASRGDPDELVGLVARL